MVALWCIIGLIISAISVSTIGAAFSIFGLRDLFSGAALAVVLMATALEFSKFVLAAYLHQRWNFLNGFLRSYLTGAIVVLSIITSMGIFGFLSNGYQSASSVLEAETIKLNALKDKQQRNENEITRISRTVEEIPANRVTKRMQLRAEIEPAIAAITRESAALANQVSDANLKILEVKQKVGPLIYISKAFNVDLDNVVKYLIMILVLVFDPLAICLVIASSEALMTRRKAIIAESMMVKDEEETARTAAVQPIPTPLKNNTPLPASEHGGSDEIIHMRFTEDQDKKAE